MEHRIAARRWLSRPAGHLPHGLILFDGVCVLCSNWVRFVLKRDADALFRFATIQSSLGRGIAESLLIHPDQPETNAVVLDGVVHFKSDGAIAVLSRLPGWTWISALKLFPKRPRDWVYDRIAQNRYGIFGRSASCMIPSPAERERFLDGGRG